MAQQGNQTGRKGRRMYSRAQRDVQMAYQGQDDALARARAQAMADYQSAMAGYGSAYGGMEGLLSGLMPQYMDQSNAVAKGLKQNLGDFQGLLHVPLTAPEQQAGGTRYAQLGAGGLELLGSMQQRGVDYGTSAAREGALAQQAGMGNLTQDYMNQLQDLSSQSTDMYSNFGEQVLARLDELRQQRLQNQLTQSQLSSDEAFNQLVQDMAGNSGLGGGGGGGGGLASSPGGGGGGVSTPNGGGSPGGGAAPAPTDFAAIVNAALQGNMPTWLRRILSGQLEPRDLNENRRRIFDRYDERTLNRHDAPDVYTPGGGGRGRQ